MLVLKFAGSRLVSWVACAKRALVSSVLALPFSKTAVNDLTIGRNCCLSCWVIRLVDVRGNTPENKCTKRQIRLAYIDLDQWD